MRLWQVRRTARHLVPWAVQKSSGSDFEDTAPRVGKLGSVASWDNELRDRCTAVLTTPMPEGSFTVEVGKRGLNSEGESSHTSRGSCCMTGGPSSSMTGWHMLQQQQVGHDNLQLMWERGGLHAKL
eukprot:CAMPEP_0179075208 /NCGR_PEP_ID=MMETSP0796-20121207/33477_1 /TAXON_ID=73915 /ORGANISM="Pyrodinium bahamense, Strain pbaha01" /LENGTH=125 /DNA_ID=CAMNT_0020772443 /DNA_START=720 /DNA_END=1094 /DNA_ORIENTATION=+